MKVLFLSLLIALLASCNEGSTQKTQNNSDITEQQEENSVNKYLGYWQRDDRSKEVIRIFKNGFSFYISDGENEVPINYDNQEDKFKIHRSDQDIEIIYSAQDNQLHWVVIEFGQSSGEVIWKYNFLKQ